MTAARKYPALYWTLIVLFVVLSCAALLISRPNRETVDDLQRLSDEGHADYQRVVDGMLVDSDVSAWLDCERVAQDARRLLDELRTELGVVVLSAHLNIAIADGCDGATPGLGIESLVERFDGNKATVRWPNYARLFYGLEDETHTNAMRAALVESRQRAECSGRRVAPLRKVHEVPDREAMRAILHDCEKHEPEPA